MFTGAFVFLSLAINSADTFAQSHPSHAHPLQKKHFLVVIDPGHGGSDTGAHFTEKSAHPETQTEKHLVLLIARDLARELIIRGNQAVLTRNDDESSVQLSNRTALANKLKADLFISIHMNSSPEVLKSGGVETFILNHATDDTSKRLADFENEVLKDSQANQNAGSSNVSLIMKDLILDGNLEPSRKVACSVQARLTAAIHNKNQTSSRDRGVKQALFYVLLGTDMPSILIEAGFINAKEDRERVLNPKSRLRMVAQIASGIEDYRRNKAPAQCQVQNEKQFHRNDEPTKRRKNL